MFVTVKSLGTEYFVVFKNKVRLIGWFRIIKPTGPSLLYTWWLQIILDLCIEIEEQGLGYYSYDGLVYYLKIESVLILI